MLSRVHVRVLQVRDAMDWQGDHEGRPYMLCLLCLKCRLAGRPRGSPLHVVPALLEM
jgi:hypothetical protein